MFGNYPVPGTDTRFLTGPFTLHGFRPFVVAGTQPDRVPRVIIEHRQRMTPPTASHRKVAFEIHLPQIVGSRVLKPLQVRCSRAGSLVELTMTTQNLRDRARHWNSDVLQILQPPTQLPTTPRRMLATQGQHALFDRSTRSPRRLQRPTRLIQQPRRAVRHIPRQPLVTRLPADPKPAT